MVQSNVKTGKERPLLRMSKDTVVEMMLCKERDHKVLLDQVAAQAAQEVSAATKEAERAQKQARDAQNEAETRIAAAAVAEAKKRQAAAVVAQQAADDRVRQVREEAAAKREAERLVGREYWGAPTVTADGLGLESLAADVCRLLDTCLQPGDANQLGKGVDARGWEAIPEGERSIRVQRAWRVQRETLWQQYRDKLAVVAEQMERVPAECRGSISVAKPKPLRQPPAHWDAMAFARATERLPGQLRGDVNETYLLTGVPSETVHKILMSGFDERFR